MMSMDMVLGHGRAGRWTIILLARWKGPESSFFVVSVAAAIKFATILTGRRERQDEGRRHDDS